MSNLVLEEAVDLLGVFSYPLSCHLLVHLLLCIHHLLHILNNHDLMEDAQNGLQTDR